MTAPRLVLARRVIDRAIAARSFPGAAVEVGRRDGVTATLGAGHLSYAAGSPPVTADTVYDLASLTKVLAASALAMELIDAGRLGLDDLVARWSPAWQAADRAGVQVRDRLEHASGLPAHRRYFEGLTGRAEVAKGKPVCHGVDPPRCAGPAPRLAMENNNWRNRSRGRPLS